MYLIHTIIQLQEREREIEEEEKRRKREEKMAGPLAYAVPSMMEYVVFPSEDIPRLKAYIRSTPLPAEVLQKAAKKGFPLYFQLFKRPFTNGEIYDILNNTTRETMQTKPIIHCLHYNQVIHPALCIARNLIYPKEVPASPYYLEVKERLEKAITKQEKKRLRREVKRHSPTFDPYPDCRSCIMGKKLIQQSCLGAEFDPEDQECIECPSKRECCQLMRLRIESILEGDEDEVRKDILEQWKRLSQKRKEVKEEMTKKKKKAEEVTEEVIEETEAPEKKTKRTPAERRAERKKKAATEEAEEEVSMTRAEKRKAAKEAEEEEEAPKKKKGKKGGGAEKGSVKSLLKKLQEAKDEGDQEEARQIRAELRKEGYSLRAHGGK